MADTPDTKKMKIALVHDYLIQDGGAERVVQTFHEVWPEAPVFVLLHDRKKMPAMNGWDVRPSFLQDLPLPLSLYKWLLPLMPAATERHQLEDFDVVLSDTSSFAKGVITRADATHICYCHTTTRYLAWSDARDHVAEQVRSAALASALQPAMDRLRRWDRMATSRVDRFIANSETVRDRITRHYGRDADVIFPPVETARFRPSDRVGNYYLAGGRLVPYKRFDIIVQAFTKTRLPVKIFGTGPEYARLKAMAGPTVELLGHVTEEEKADLYAHAIAYLNPQEEDFGITAVEAMAAGRPVIAYGKGGGAETVIPGVTGEWMDEQSWEELAGTIIKFKPENYDPKVIRAHAEQFDKEKFKAKIKEYVERTHENANA
jgi:glycosyltransferase involved in cell wall biosynthesis